MHKIIFHDCTNKINVIIKCEIKCLCINFCQSPSCALCVTILKYYLWLFYEICVTVVLFYVCVWLYYYLFWNIVSAGTMPHRIKRELKINGFGLVNKLFKRHTNPLNQNHSIYCMKELSEKGFAVKGANQSTIDSFDKCLLTIPSFQILTDDENFSNNWMLK